MRGSTTLVGGNSTWAMSEEEWVFDSHGVPDEEELLRRIPWLATHVVFNAQEGTYSPSLAAFRRKPREGLSVHLLSVVESQGRSAESAYDEARVGTVAFLAKVPRSVGAGVVALVASEELESDAVLRAAHAEVRPSTTEANRGDWSLIRNTIISACRWVVVPKRRPSSGGGTD